MDSDEETLDSYDGDSAEDYYYSDVDGDDYDVDELIDGGDDGDDDDDVNYGYASDDFAVIRSEECFAIAWFADEGTVRKAVGLLSNPIVQPKTAKKLACGICFDSFSRKQILSAVCGHPYCTCWKGYITTSINDGPGCLLLRCPDPSCRATVGQDMIIDLASDEDKKKYSQYLIRSYVEDKKKDILNAYVFKLAG